MNKASALVSLITGILITGLASELPLDADRSYKAKITISAEGDVAPKEIDVQVEVEINRPFAGWGTVSKKIALEADGICEIETKKGADTFEMSVSAEGHYPSTVRLHPYDRPPGKYWNPPDTKLDLELRKIVEPRRLLEAQRPIKYLSEQGELIGYDMIIRDWVRPQGEGEVADVLFSVSEWSQNRGEKRPSVILTFPQKGTGIIRVNDPDKGQVISACPVGRIAPG